MTDAGPKLLRGLLEVFILESLEQSPKHGYALLKEMTETFGQEPNRNRIYPLLGRLVRDGYVREVSESGGNRTLYALTDAGREALRAYRRLPGAFRHALRRIWSVEPHAHAAAAGRGVAVLDDDGASVGDAAALPEEDEEAEGEDARPVGPAAADVAAPPEPPRAAAPAPLAASMGSPAAAPTPARAGQLPYPCPDARVTMAREPSSGALSIQLTGCPMGAYEYCPQCPIHHAVHGMRRLMFPD